MTPLLAFAPGLLYLTLGALLIVGLRRHDDRLPLGLALGLLVLAAVPFRAALFGGQVLLPLDSLRGQAPFRQLPPTVPHGNPIQGDLIQLIQPSTEAVRNAWLRGEWPLWNPRQGLGISLLGDPQAQALQPLGLLTLPLAPPAAPGALAALRTLMALLFTFLLLRRLGAGSGPALAGAVAYGGSGFLQLWIGWPLATTAAVLPAVLYGILRVDLRGWRRDLGVLTAALFALLTAGHPQTIGYAAVVAVGFAMLRLAPRDRAARRSTARRLAAAVVVAGLLAAPALLSGAESVHGSLRASRGAPSVVAGTASRLAQAVAPNALGNSRYARYWGAVNSNEDAAAFVGTAALLGALVTAAAALARRKAVLDQERAALLLAALALGLSAVGIGRLGFLAALGLTIAATAAFERLSRTPAKGRLAVGVALGLLAAIHLGSYFLLKNPAEPGDLDILRRGFLLWHLRFALVSAVVLTLGRGRRWPAFVVALSLAAELHLAYGREQTLAPATLATVTPGTLAFLEGQPNDFRIAAFGTALPPNLASLHGLSDVRIYNPMAPLRTFDHLAPVLAGWQGEAPLLTAADDALYDRLTVGYLLGAPEDTCPTGTGEAFRDVSGVVCRRASPWTLARPIAAPATPLTVERTAQGDGLRVLAPPAGRIEVAVDPAPGWRVVGAQRVAGDLLAFERFPSSETVELLYRPMGLVGGATLAALGWALAGLWLARPSAGARMPR